MLIKYALEDFSPIEVAFFQASIGAFGLLAIVLFQGGRARRDVGHPAPALACDPARAAGHRRPVHPDLARRALRSLGPRGRAPLLDPDVRSGLRPALRPQRRDKPRPGD